MVCTAEEALGFVASQLGNRAWDFSIARRSTEDQILRWRKGLEPGDPTDETSPVLWIVGIHASQPLTIAQFSGWTFPSTLDGGSASTGHHDAVFVFTEDRSPVMAERPAVFRSEALTPGAPMPRSEYVAALQEIAELPEVAPQIEGFPDLEDLCSMTSD